jgi:hypothetical protein
MDLNQRFMYPQIVRSGRYDSAVFGTSTMRLLDPAKLDGLFGGRFANLGLNAGTPWEQMQLADLFLRHVPRPKTLVFGLDTTWCEADADSPAKRLTFRAFPPWLYDEDPLNDFSEIFNLKSLEIASRVAMYRLALMPERIRGDGFEVFTPPEALYDAARARQHIWNGEARLIEVQPALPQPDASGGGFPALAWLDALLARVPRGSEVVLVLPPIHVAVQARPGSRAAARDEACKQAIAVIGARRGAATLDFRIASAVTREDTNYWDPLHYRLPVAEAFGAEIARAARTGEAPAQAPYRVLTPPRPAPAR